MALVDWEAVVLDLEAHFASKNSHGQRDLQATLLELKATHRVPETLADKTGRVYLPHLLELIQERSASPADGGPERTDAMASSDHPS